MQYERARTSLRWADSALLPTDLRFFFISSRSSSRVRTETGIIGSARQPLEEENDPTKRALDLKIPRMSVCRSAN